MYRELLTAIGVALLPAPLSAQEPPLRVPRGEAVLLDGRCDADEYARALRRKLSDQVELRLQRHGDLVALCLRYTPPAANGVDLFIADAKGALHNLHASAMLGQRRLAGDQWPEWQWWNNTGWSANPVRPRDFRQLQFEPSEATEFVIRRETFPEPWRIRIDVHAREPGVIYPSGSDAKDAANWVVLNL